MQFKIIYSKKLYGQDFMIIAKSRRRAIKKILSDNPELIGGEFYFKYPNPRVLTKSSKKS
jgi:hypothetical protein